MAGVTTDLATGRGVRTLPVDTVRAPNEQQSLWVWLSGFWNKLTSPRPEKHPTPGPSPLRGEG